MAGSSADRPSAAASSLAAPAVPDVEASPAAARRRTAEIWTAVVVAVFGLIVSAESLTHDIGWNETGPGSGYFPFRVGLLLVLSAIVLLFQIVRTSKTDVFVTIAQLRRGFSVFWPAVLLVAAMFPLGCYVPSAAYLTWMIRRHGSYSWIRSIASALAITVAFYAVFDLWFAVPLEKGPVEAAFGLY